MNLVVEAISIMSVAVAGGAAVLFGAVTYAMRLRPSRSNRRLHEPKVFQDRKEMYRERRNRFRNHPRAMEELEAWKSRDGEFDYTVL